MNPDDVVLVALINAPRDLEIARREHWYRIPTRHAPKYFSGAQALAFYLPAAFRERKWSIDTYAAVRGHELTRRRDLFPDEPKHPRADETYYKLQLGATRARVPPIVSKRGRRVLFVWTNWEKFSNAREWNDLYLRTPAHEKLYAALRADDLDIEREIVVREGRARYRADFLIYLPQGQIAITLGEQSSQKSIGARQLACVVTPAEIENDVARVRRAIQRAARELQQSYSTRKS
ncbi:MAG: hypothetical protein BroJett039_04860 [Chloroflexota bacterium]|nr:MAG: hypothetical protein BroJett039_04860 [Chloroflexota bacterium]